MRAAPGSSTVAVMRVGTSKPSISAVARCGSAAKRRPGCERKKVGAMRISSAPAALRPVGTARRALEKEYRTRAVPSVAARLGRDVNLQLAQPRARKLHAQPALLEVLTQPRAIGAEAFEQLRPLQRRPAGQLLGGDRHPAPLFVEADGHVDGRLILGGRLARQRRSRRPGRAACARRRDPGGR